MSREHVALTLSLYVSVDTMSKRADWGVKFLESRTSWEIAQAVLQ